LGGLDFKIPENESDKECAEAKGGLFHTAMVIVVDIISIAALMPLSGENEAVWRQPGVLSKLASD
jgi:hypothetical protein